MTIFLSPTQTIFTLWLGGESLESLNYNLDRTATQSLFSTFKINSLSTSYVRVHVYMIVLFPIISVKLA